MRDRVILICLGPCSRKSSAVPTGEGCVLIAGLSGEHAHNRPASSPLTEGDYECQVKSFHLINPIEWYRRRLL